MTWVRLDENMVDHPKVAKLSDRAFRLHIAALCYANRQLTDGHVSTSVVRNVIPNRGARYAQELVDAGVWEVNENGWMVHDYEDYQPSKADVLALRDKRAAAGRIGGKRSKPPSKTEASASNVLEAKTKPVPSRSLTRNRSSKPAAPSSATHGDGTDQEQRPALPAQLARILDPAITRELKPAQVTLVTTAWNTSTELRQSLADIEAAENPIAMLVSVAKRIAPPDEQTPAQRAATAASKRAGAVQRCRYLWHQGIDQGDQPDALRESLEREYRHDPSIVTEAITPPTKEDVEL